MAGWQPCHCRAPQSLRPRGLFSGGCKRVSKLSSNHGAVQCSCFQTVTQHIASHRQLSLSVLCFAAVACSTRHNAAVPHTHTNNASPGPAGIVQLGFSTAAGQPASPVGHDVLQNAASLALQSRRPHLHEAGHHHQCCHSWCELHLQVRQPVAQQHRHACKAQCCEHRAARQHGAPANPV